LVDCVEVLRAVNKNIEKRIKNSDKETKEKFAFIWDFEKDQAKPDEFSEYIIKRISKIIDEGDDLDV
ncbi:hypothetical protein LJC10_02430, partial [Selenomonadales bacterium OttesenSCG-928-I06]|nr:hypothetical protein [Selenomonadales bacterium OttesenSCG-928-I06]